MNRLLRGIALAALLLAAQWLLATHGIEHALSADNGEVCVSCLALGGMQGVASAPVSATLLPSAACAPVVTAALPAPSFARRPPFLSRAPPVFPS